MRYRCASSVHCHLDSFKSTLVEAQHGILPHCGLWVQQPLSTSTKHPPHCGHQRRRVCSMRQPAPRCAVRYVSCPRCQAPHHTSCRQTDPLLDSISTAWVGNELTMLKRRENDGMDFAAHNSSISWLDRLGTRRCVALLLKHIKHITPLLVSHPTTASIATLYSSIPR